MLLPEVPGHDENAPLHAPVADVALPLPTATAKRPVVRQGAQIGAQIGAQSCGDFSLRIARDGTWHYRGSPIGRKELVCLFASVLRREADGTYWLETPAERGRIEVEDAPFLAVELFWRDCRCGDDATQPRQCLTFRTNLDEMVTANAAHPIRVHLCPTTRQPSPYVTVRPGLEARITRAVFYELVALAQAERVDGRDVLGVWSEGIFFPIDDLPDESEVSVAAA